MLVFLGGCIIQPNATQVHVTATNIPPTAIPSEIVIPPTFTSDTAIQLLKSKLADNGSCSLPCIWGITPGETTLDDLKFFINNFGDNDMPGVYYSSPSIYENLGGLGIGVWENDTRISYRFDYRGTDSIEYLRLSAEAYIVSGNEIDQSAFVAPDQLSEAFHYYTPQRILTNYGKPDQIILAPFPDMPERPSLWVPFSLVLFYKEKGILIEYVAPKNITAEGFEFCASQLAYISVFTWQPQNKLTLDMVVNFYSGYNLSSTTFNYYKLLEDTTSLTIKEFADNFIEGESYCLQTPSILWGNQ